MLIGLLRKFGLSFNLVVFWQSIETIKTFFTFNFLLLTLGFLPTVTFGLIAGYETFPWAMLLAAFYFLQKRASQKSYF